MRLAFVADIHGNLTALEAVIQDIKKAAPDAVYHLGDLAGNGSRPSEAVDRIRDLGWPGVHGNVDEMLWAPERLADLAWRAPERQLLRKVLFEELAPRDRAALGPERVAWLKSLPCRLDIGEITLVHASPDDLWRAPLATAPDAEFEATYRSLGAKAVVYAHIHHPHVRRLSGLVVANTGSVSLPYDGDPRSSYLLFTDGTWQTRRIEYAVEAEVRLLEEHNVPRAAWLASLLRTGKYQPPF